MTLLCFISDTHNKHRKVVVPECDILMHCGDFSAMGRHHETGDFLSWFRKQPARHKVFIAGNHDISFERDPSFKNEILKEYGDLIYLEESGAELEGIKIWGSPWTPYFHNWAFNFREGKSGHFQAEAHWKRIPEGTNILLTHGPSHDVLDLSHNGNYRAGCRELSQRIVQIKPDLHAFGHVHEAYGENGTSLAPTYCINASTCDLKYQPVNPPILVEA